jgi:hypothetical protein
MRRNILLTWWHLTPHNSPTDARGCSSSMISLLRATNPCGNSSAAPGSDTNRLTRLLDHAVPEPPSPHPPSYQKDAFLFHRSGSRSVSCVLQVHGSCHRGKVGAGEEWWLAHSLAQSDYLIRPHGGGAGVRFCVWYTTCYMPIQAEIIV